MADRYPLNSLGKHYKDDAGVVLESYGIGIIIEESSSSDRVRKSYLTEFDYKYAFLDLYNTAIEKALQRAWPLLQDGKVWSSVQPQAQERITEWVADRNKVARKNASSFGVVVAGEPARFLPTLAGSGPEPSETNGQRWIKPYGPDNKPSAWFWPINLGKLNLTKILELSTDPELSPPEESPDTSIPTRDFRDIGGCVDRLLYEAPNLSLPKAIQICSDRFPEEAIEGLQSEDTRKCVESITSNDPGIDFSKALRLCNDDFEIDDIDDVVIPDWYKQEPSVLVRDTLFPEDYNISVLTTFSTQDLNDSVVEQAKEQAYFIAVNDVLRSYSLPILQQLSFEKQLEIEQPLGGDGPLLQFSDYRVDAQADSIYVLMLATNLDEKIKRIFPEVGYRVGGDFDSIRIEYGEGGEDFSALILSVSEILLDYDNNIKTSDFGGSLEHVDLASDSLSLLTSEGIISQFLQEQPNFSTTTDYTLKFALDEEYQIVSVTFSSLLEDGTFSKNIDYLNESLSKRDKFYLKSLEAIDDSTPENTPWATFLEFYVKFPDAVIYTAWQRRGKEFNDSLADALDRKYGGAIETAKSCVTDTVASFEDFAVSAQESIKSIKTLEQDAEEKLVYAGNSFKQQVVEQAEQVEENVDDQLVADLEGTIRDIKNLDQVFGQVLNKISLGNLADALVSCLPEIDITCQPLTLPPVPTVGFPTILPTVDIMSDFSDNIFSAIIEALTQVFVSILSQIFDQLLDICNGEDDALRGIRDTSSLNDLLSGAPRPSTPGRPYNTGDENDDIKLGLLDSVCAITDSVPIEDLGPYLDELNRALDDISLLVSSRELCRLFTGKSSQKTLSLIRNLLKNSYPLLFDCLKDKSMIAKFFYKVGTTIGSEFCDTISELAPIQSPRLEECDIDEPLEFEFEELSLLYSGRNIDPSTINELLTKAKERKEKQMLGLKNAAKLISDNEQGKNPFSDMLNSLNQNECGTGTSFFSYSHESYDFMQKELLDTMFDPISASFDRDLRGVVDAMITNRDGDVEIDKLVQFLDPNGEKSDPSVNPKLKELESQGIDIEPILNSPGDLVTVKETKLEAAPSVRTLLKSLESEDTFTPELDEESSYYQLNINNDPSVAAGLEKFYENFSSLMNTAQIDGFDGPIELDPATVAKALPEWKIRYKLPYIENVNSELKDDYIIEIFSGQSVQQSQELLRKEVSKDLDPDIENFIFSQLENVSEPLSIAAAGQTFLAPAVQSVFGKFASNRWYQTMLGAETKENLSTSETASFSKFNREMSKFFAAQVHPQAAKDLFSLLASQIGDSILFDSPITSLGVSGVVQRTYSPNLLTVEFNRTPTPLEVACGITPDPLKTDCFKREAANNIANNSCEITAPVPPVSPFSPSGPDAWDREVLKSVVKMTIRAYVFDFTMKSVFLLPNFTVEEAVDDYLVEFGMKKMLSEMQQYEADGKNYLNNFKYWSYVTYIDDIGGELTPRIDVTEEMNETALKYLFSKSFQSVAPDVRDNIERSLPGTVATHKKPKDYLVEDWLPLIDIPDKEGRPRFVGQKFGGIVSNISNTGNSTIDGKNVNLENGNFLLEKFYKIVRRTDSDIKKNLVKSDAFSLQAGEDLLNSQVAEKITDIFNNSWEQNFTDTPGETIQYVNIDDFQVAYSDLVSEINLLIKQEVCDPLPPVPGAIDYIEYTTDCIEPITLSDFFEEVTPGMRMVYLLPVQNNEFSLAQGNVESKFGTIVPSYKQYYGGNTYFSNALKSFDLQQGEETKLNSAMTTVRKRERAYSIVEEYETVLPGGGKSVREIYPIPLVDTAVCIGDSDWWNNNKDKPLDGFVSASSWSSIYNIQESSLKQDLTETEEFRVLFDYVFPLDRYLAMLQVYTIMSVSSLPNIDSAFAGTKDELYSLFNVLALSSNTQISSTGYRFQGIPTNKEISKAMTGLKVGLETPCFSFSFAGPGLNGIGLDVVIKMALKTPLLIFKGFVEIADPNIKLSKFIFDLLKALGICIPIPFISFALLPPTVFGYPPFGIGIGPPLSPFGFGYLGLGFHYEADCCFYNYTPLPDSPLGPSGGSFVCNDVCDEKTY